MSRTVTTRIRCHTCFPGYAELRGEPAYVDSKLELRGWRKDADGNDICPFCIEKETARGIRLRAIQFAQAAHLLRDCDVDDRSVNAARIIAAQNQVIGELRDEMYIADKGK